MANEISVDERGRTSLAKVRTRKFSRYTAEEKPDGTLVLTPVVSVEVAKLPPEVAAQVKKSLGWD